MARSVLRTGQSDCEKSRGPDHPAARHYNIARLLQDQGEFAGARPLYEPQQSRAVASGLRRSCRARPLYQRTLTICENALGSEHPDTATRLNNLAGLLQ